MISIVIPTITGREEYLARCIRGYKERTAAAHTFIVIQDAETCGIAWQEGVDLSQGDYIHLTADDIVPGVGWDGPMIEATDRNQVPAALVVACVGETLDDEDMPTKDNPLSPTSNFYERISPPSVVLDWSVAVGDSEYPSVPFCTREQWAAIGPMIASHYGTDKWFGFRAKQAGLAVVARHGAHFYHYAAHVGRIPKYYGWCHMDLLDFDLNIAYPAYLANQLEPHVVHPLRGTPEGRTLARAWRMMALPHEAVRPWEYPDLGPEYR